MQKLANMAVTGKANLVFSDEKDQVIILDKDGNILAATSRKGFNDTLNNQGYVNASTGAGTDAWTFLYTDAEERAHNYVGKDENAAKNAANKEMAYYNFMADWTGGYLKQINHTLLMKCNGKFNAEKRCNEICAIRNILLCSDRRGS